MSEFIWTDELVEYPFNIYLSKVNNREHSWSWEETMLDFKKSKQQKQRDWEIVERYYAFEGGGIRSVKRLSDGEVLWVGDKVEREGDYFSNKSIAKFVVYGNDMVVIMEDNKGVFHLQHVTKAKKPLFTTEDGKGIFNGDEYWFVVTSNSTTLAEFGRSWKPFSHIAEEVNNVKPALGGVQFSTEEAAKAYVIMNKPCLSANDIIKLCYSWFLTEGDNPDHQSYISENKLKKSVEKKLGM